MQISFLTCTVLHRYHCKNRHDKRGKGGHCNATLVPYMYRANSASYHTHTTGRQARGYTVVPFSIRVHVHTSLATARPIRCSSGHIKPACAACINSCATSSTAFVGLAAASITRAVLTYYSKVITTNDKKKIKVIHVAKVRLEQCGTPVGREGGREGEREE